MDEERKPLLATALKYRHGEDNAPRLVAKGRGVVAERIMQIARDNGVPVREDKELVEVLSALEVNQEIPSELYRAVAEILAFLYKLNAQTAGKLP